MKKALLILSMLAFLGGAAAGLYLYFQKSAEAAVGQTEQHLAAKEVDAHSGKKGTFVELDPLILPIIDESGVNQVVSIVVVIEVNDSTAAKEVNRIAPRLKDAYIQEMYGILNGRMGMQGGVIQVGVLKEKLSAISHRVLGDDMVNDVLLQVVQQRPI